MKKITIEELKRKEKEEKFVFHGSSKKLTELTPQQAYSGGIKDGDPAVFASTETTIPIFMSLFDPSGNDEKISCDIKDDYEVILSASEKILNRVNQENKPGYIYVFNKEDFKHHDFNEWVSHKAIKPIFFCEVYLKDLEQIIEIKLI